MHHSDTSSTNLSKWSDICLKNIVIFLAAAKRLNLDQNLIWDATRQATGKPFWTLRTLAQAWVSLPQYQQIENAFVAASGHASHLIEVGRTAAAASFGFSDSLQKFLLEGLIRFITSPRVAIRLVDHATRAFNHNKKFRLVVDEPDHCVFEIEYNLGPNGERRTATEDYRSVLYYIPGIMESTVQIWPHQTTSSVVYRTINVTPRYVIEHEWPGVTVTINHDTLFINYEEYGEVVHLVRDAATGAYLGDYQAHAAPGTLAAILITRDVCTPDQHTGELKPVMRTGEIYRHNRDIPTHLAIQWHTNWVFKLIESIPGLLKPIDRALSQEERTATAELIAATERAERELLTEITERHAPTRRVAQLLMHNAYQEAMLPTLVMQIDVCGFTKLAAERGSRGTAEFLTKTMGAIKHMVQDEYGLWPYKFMGDGALVVWANWDRHPDDPGQYQHAHEAAIGMVECARRLHELARNNGVKLRIGLAYDEVVWFDLNIEKEIDPNPLFEGCGQGLNRAARLEQYGAFKGTTALAPEVVGLIHPEITNPPNPIMGEFHYRGHVAEKHGKTIEVWLDGPIPPVSED